MDGAFPGIREPLEDLVVSNKSGAGYPGAGEKGFFVCGALQWVTPADLAGSVVFDRWDKSEQVTRDRFSG